MGVSEKLVKKIRTAILNAGNGAFVQAEAKRAGEGERAVYVPSVNRFVAVDFDPLLHDVAVRLKAEIRAYSLLYGSVLLRLLEVEGERNFPHLHEVSRSFAHSWKSNQVYQHLMKYHANIVEKYEAAGGAKVEAIGRATRGKYFEKGTWKSWAEWQDVQKGTSRFGLTRGLRYVLTEPY